MSIEGDTSDLRAPVALNPDLIGEERNVYSCPFSSFSEAPAGRHVYRQPTSPKNPSPRGATCGKHGFGSKTIDA